MRAEGVAEITVSATLFKNRIFHEIMGNLSVKKQNKNSVITEQQALILMKQANYLNMLDYYKQEELIKSINYEEEKQIFLKQCKSKQTSKKYLRAINILEEYCKERDIKILFFKAKEVDDFILFIKNSKLSSLHIRLIVSACSSFFTFLHRRHPLAIENFFIGTKMRPPARNKKKIEVPSAREIDLIVNDISDKAIKCAIIFIKECGLRVGALPNLEIRKKKYFSFSKGKEISGNISDNAIKYLKKNKLDLKQPFKNKSSEVIRNIFYRSSKRLYNKKIIKAKYSIHDIRHFFAIKLYKKTKDIELVRQALNHSNIAITGLYLKSLETRE